MVEACVARYQRIDILHNNVGKSQGDAEASELTAENWDEIHDLNIKSYFLTSKHVLPVMRAQGSGCIINISSIASICTMPTLAYKASKAAVNALTQNLALANAQHGVRVNAILPGLMDTPMAIERRARERSVDRVGRDAFPPLKLKDFLKLVERERVVIDQEDLRLAVGMTNVFCLVHGRPSHRLWIGEPF